jgi:hypothetical protein
MKDYWKSVAYLKGDFVFKNGKTQSISCSASASSTVSTYAIYLSKRKVIKNALKLLSGQNCKLVKKTVEIKYVVLFNTKISYTNNEVIDNLITEMNINGCNICC